MKRLFIGFLLIVFLFTAGCSDSNTQTSILESTSSASVDIETESSSSANIIDETVVSESSGTEHVSEPSYSREDYDEMRQKYEYTRSNILDYDLKSSGTSFLDIDETAGKIENYLSNVLAVIHPGEEMNDINNYNDYLYRAAAFNTDSVRDDDPMLQAIPYVMYPMMKEHIRVILKTSHP